MPVENKGNLVMQRAFVNRDGVKLHRIDTVAAVAFVAGSTAYHYTEELPPFGNGRKSPLYVVCELIRELYQLEKEEGGDHSASRELAEYPFLFYRQITGGATATCADFKRLLSFLLSEAAGANYRLGGKSPDELSIDELREMEARLLNVAGTASVLLTVLGNRARELEGAFAPPVVGERLRGRPTVDG